MLWQQWHVSADQKRLKSSFILANLESSLGDYGEV